MASPPDDYLLMNIFTCICCPWGCCLAIPALMKSLAVRDAINRGDRDEAVRESILAKKLGIAALIVGLIIGIISTVSSAISWYNTVKNLSEEEKQEAGYNTYNRYKG
jgi:hypothetical protein